MENNPGYIIMMKMGYKKKSGLGQEGKGRLRPLQQLSKETSVVEVSDTLFFEFRPNRKNFLYQIGGNLKWAKNGDPTESGSGI